MRSWVSNNEVLLLIKQVKSYCFNFLLDKHQNIYVEFCTIEFIKSAVLKMEVTTTKMETLYAIQTQM